MTDSDAAHLPARAACHKVAVTRQALQHAPSIAYTIAHLPIRCSSLQCASGASAGNAPTITTPSGTRR